MAQSKSFFGLRKGSTKSHTYSTLDGKQITKDRVYDVKNPRTEGQMKQRMLMTTVGAAYKYMKSIADHSFEGKASGMACMREFNSRNLNLFKKAASANGHVAFNEYKDGDINPLPFILSNGSLPGFAYKLNDASQLEIAFDTADADFATAEGIYAAMGIKKNDLVTFCTVIGEGGVINNVFEYTAERFDVVRLVADKSGAVANPIDAFTVSTNNIEATANAVVEGSTLKITSGECDFGAVIQSRKADTNWLRSSAVMVVSADLIDGVQTANQLATYPVGTELILNNGPMENQGGSNAPALPAPSLSFAQSSINANGTTTVNAPQLNGTPSGATVTYNSQNPTIATVNPSTGVIQPVSNGTATIIARTSATDEYAAGQASFKVVVTGIEQQALVVTPSRITLDANSTAKQVTFENPTNAEVTVSMGAGVKGVSSSVADNKQSVTFTLTDTKSGKGGTATIAVAGKQATVTIVVDIEPSDVGL